MTSLEINVANLSFLSFLNSIVDKKSSHGFLKNLYIEKNRENLEFFTSNLDISSFFVLSEFIQNEPQTTELYSVKSDTFCQFLKKSKDQILINIEDSNFNIINKKTKCALVNSREKKPLNLEEIRSSMEFCGKININVLKTLINKVKSSLNVDDTKTIIEIQEDKLTFGVYEASKRIALGFCPMESKKFLKFPIKTKILGNILKFLEILKTFDKTLHKDLGEINIFFHNGCLIFSLKDAFLIINSLENMDSNFYPERFLDDWNETVKINLLEFRNIVEKCQICASTNVRNINIIPLNNTLEVSTFDSINGYALFRCSFTGVLTQNIFLNVDILLDFLGLCSGTEILIHSTNSGNAIVIEDNCSLNSLNITAFYIVAPLVMNKFSTLSQINQENSLSLPCKDLIKRIGFLNSIVEKKSPCVEIQNIEISPKSKEISMTTTNLEIIIQDHIKINSDQNNSDQDSSNFHDIRVKSSVFSECFKFFKKDIKILSNNRNIEIQEENGFFILNNCEGKLPIESYKSGDYTLVCSLGFGVFQSLLESININIEENGLLRILIKDNKLTLSLNDKKRVCFRFISLESLEEKCQNIDILINPKYLKELMNLHGEVRIYCDSFRKKLLFKSSLDFKNQRENDLFIIIKAIDGFRLNLENFLNLDSFQSCEFNVSEFKTAVDKVILLGSANLVSLKFNITSDSIKFSTYNYFENSYLNSEIESKSSENIVFELNGEHVASMIKTLQEFTMFILFNSHRREIFFTNLSRDLFYINIKLLKIN